jgi:Tn3 transposase DDE domain
MVSLRTKFWFTHDNRERRNAGTSLRTKGSNPILQASAIRGEDTKRNLKHVKDRVSGLNLLVAAIILWNTTYLQRAVDHLRNQGYHPASGDMAHLSPLGWEHINLTGDYHWDTSPTLGPDEFRLLRTHAHDFAAAA